jgi:hypothetical protein
MIRALVKAGRYSAPGDEELLATVLVQRRDKIARYYLNAINPLVGFALSAEGRLTFRNAAVDAAAAPPPAEGYRASWFTYDNATDAATPLGAPTSGPALEIAAPAPLPSSDAAFVKVSIVAVGASHEAWMRPVDVYFRRAGSNWQLVGVDRLPTGT